VEGPLHGDPRPSSDDLPFRQVAEHLATPCWISDAQGNLVWGNGAWLAYTGMTIDGIAGRGLDELHDPAAPPEVRRRWALARKAGEPAEMVLPLRGRDGGFREVLTRVVPIRRADGTITRWVGTNIDVSVQAEQQRRLAEEGRYQLLVDAITDYAIYRLDAKGIVSSWNTGAQRFKGYVAEEILGQNFSRFYTEEDRRSGLPQRALDIAAREGRFEGEGWRVRKDGARFWAQVTIDPIRAPNGELVGYAKITRDLTERRETQRALDQAREALFQSQKIEAIGQLTGGVAHDFNNLLMAILGSLDLVRKRLPQDPRITPLIDNAIQGAQRGAALTQRMLAFARKQELKPSSVDVPGLVSGIMGLLQHALGPRIALETRFAANLPPVLTDPNQLESALLNLTVNARDAMPEGGTIVIGAEPRAASSAPRLNLEPGDYVRVWVADTGAGMDAETLRRAADPFFTTKGIGKGTGLGLSMVHGLAEQCGGRLDIFSQPGEGTTVELWLPVPDADAAAEAGKPLVESLGSGPVGPLTILAVDDDSIVLINTAALLADLGHTVIEASSAEEALRILEQTSIDLLITDEAMPQMTGSQLIAAVKKTHPDLPIILATGYAELPAGSHPDVVRLAKPFVQHDLVRALAAATPAPPVVAG
jgi:PAS domain S-box-containing protein